MRPFYMPPQMPPMGHMPIAPRFPMYAPYMMRPPMMPPMPGPGSMAGMGRMPGLGPMAGLGAMPGMGAMPGPPPIPGGGAPRLDGFLAGASSLFEQAQKFTPYIQQATPMIKNLPALWRLYKGFKGADTDSETDAEKKINDLLESSTVVAPVARNKGPRSRQSASPEPPARPISPKPSRPMIFQPPFDHFE